MLDPTAFETAGAQGATIDSPSATTRAAAANAGTPERLELSISGMTCGHCVGAVRTALNDLPGVAVDHVRIGHASLRFEPETVSPAAVIEALRDAGYPASFGPAKGTRERAPIKTGVPQAPTSGSCCSSR